MKAMNEQLLAAAEALIAAKDNRMETAREWRALRRAVRQARRQRRVMVGRAHDAIPDSPFVLGQRVHCRPLEADGHIVGFENDGTILILSLVKGGTAHVPSAEGAAR